MALNEYIYDARAYLHDRNGTLYPEDQLVRYINRGRSFIAATSHCIRFLLIMPLVNGQETYAFPAINEDGIGQVIDVIAISASWGSLKPTLSWYPWTTYQAFERSYSGTVRGAYPWAWAFTGKGTNGIVYFFPIPSQVVNTEWDVLCDVLPLNDDTSPEAIPYPFSDAVAQFAAWQALIGAQRYQDAMNMQKMFKETLQMANASEGLRMPSAYGTR